MSARRGHGPESRDVAVIGLGRFGGQVAESLSRLRHGVLAIDIDQRRVQHWSSQLTQVVQADGTDEAALRQLGLPEFDRVVVAIGRSLDASVLTVIALQELGVTDIWARATSAKHARILTAVGARRVLFPEAEMGERIAHLIVSRLLDYAEFGTDFAVAKTRTPARLVGRRIDEIPDDDRQGVAIVGVHTSDDRFEYARPEVVIPPDGTLIVEGSIDQVQRFSVTD
ncbi:potassium channel family protein [Plantactinospora sp. GCM10030261]|uniref:potassium channel family protein n=1 Tax=Plantactinospora sp. GCM10030261 TaxID=3273420 RepID=UPI00361B39F8